MQDDVLHSKMYHSSPPLQFWVKMKWPSRTVIYVTPLKAGPFQSRCSVVPVFVGVRRRGEISWVNVFSTHQSSCSAHWGTGWPLWRSKAVDSSPRDAGRWQHHSTEKEGGGQQTLGQGGLLVQSPQCRCWGAYLHQQASDGGAFHPTVSPTALHITKANYNPVWSNQFVPVSAGCCLILASTSLATEFLVTYSSCHSPGCYVC